MHLSFCFISNRLYPVAEICELGLSFFMYLDADHLYVSAHPIKFSPLNPASNSDKQMIAQSGDCSKLFYSCPRLGLRQLTLHGSALLLSTMLSAELYCNDNTAKCGCSGTKPHLSLHCTVKLLVWRMERFHARQQS